MPLKRVGILSGKGGVGKTTLTASLASIASEENELNIIVLDCDVDAPNLAVLLPPNNKNKIDIYETFSTSKSNFLFEKCVKCKKCVDEHFCEFNAIEWDNKQNFPIINYLACEGCGACKVLCPEDAFEITNVKSGEIITYQTNKNFPLIYGKTRLGSTTSGKLVTDVKEMAKEVDDFDSKNLILIDGPPGIGCPAIAMISGLDYVITITEPTPTGLHDLNSIIEVINQFNIPFGIIINKADLKSSFQKKFKKYLKKTRYNILGEIKFDLAIPEAMSYAKSVVEYSPDSEASIAIHEIYNNLKKSLNLS